MCRLARSVGLPDRITLRFMGKGSHALDNDCDGLLAAKRINLSQLLTLCGCAMVNELSESDIRQIAIAGNIEMREGNAE